MADSRILSRHERVQPEGAEIRFQALPNSQTDLNPPRQCGQNPQKEILMNRSYEIMFIVRPDIEEAEIDKIVETFSGYITQGGGAVKQVEKMGRRRLAYTVRKFNDGFYILLIVDSPASLVHEIERRLRVSEQVIKFITVRTDEEDKRVAKIKKHRDAHVKRSAQPQPGAPQPVAEVAAQPDAVAQPEAAAVPEVEATPEHAATEA
jgi:small subunit ribosomal protein S6